VVRSVALARYDRAVMEELTRALAVAAVSPIVRGFAAGGTIGRKGAPIDG